MEIDAEATRAAVSELRRISGLTWEQLAELFGVSRRSVHCWASGKPLNAANHERLMRVLDVVRDADRGTAHSTRAALLEAREARPPTKCWRTSGTGKHVQPLVEGAPVPPRR
ncbi:helix-turn-helix domain-containing protein [Candidatus Palauibacter sp.]|uniref:helix-turn-helix domain-containing protein n=1 Tax=Candidatus Palauibacter sp. TaxID=3101350 RepID=UPI003B021D20